MKREERKERWNERRDRRGGQNQEKDLIISGERRREDKGTGRRRHKEREKRAKCT